MICWIEYSIFFFDLLYCRSCELDRVLLRDRHLLLLGAGMTNAFHAVFWMIMILKTLTFGWTALNHVYHCFFIDKKQYIDKKRTKIFQEVHWEYTRGSLKWTITT